MGDKTPITGETHTNDFRRNRFGRKFRSELQLLSGTMKGPPPCVPVYDSVSRDIWAENNRLKLAMIKCVAIHQRQTDRQDIWPKFLVKKMLQIESGAVLSRFEAESLRSGLPKGTECVPKRIDR